MHSRKHFISDKHFLHLRSHFFLLGKNASSNINAFYGWILDPIRFSEEDEKRKRKRNQAKEQKTFLRNNCDDDIVHKLVLQQL
jgi:hypothetical protein